jgi:hypothetical protein
MNNKLMVKQPYKLYPNMKKITLSLIILLSFFENSPAQSEQFINEWTNTEKTIQKIDSAANTVQRQISFFRNRTSKIKLYSRENMQIRHTIKITYKNGNICTRHKYKTGKKDKIKVLIINGQTLLIKYKYRNNMSNRRVVNVFANTGNKTWSWTYQNNEVKQYPKREIIHHWH